MAFKEVNYFRLMCVTEIADWAQIWYSTLKDLLEKLYQCTDEENNYILEDLIFDETTSMCFENEDNKNIREIPKKKGRNFLFRGFSEETVFTLSHALRTYASCIKHMLT